MYDPQKIIQNNPIHEVISNYVQLTKNGNEYQGSCPFHNDKTPSFSVVPNKNFYHCFGCGMHGDVIDFVQNYFNVPFFEACEILGGEKLPPDTEPTKKNTEQENLYEGIEILPECKSIIEVGVKREKIYNVKRDQYQNYTPNYVHEYRTEDGLLAGYIIRIDISNKKIILPIQDIMKDNERITAVIPFVKPRMLYNIQSLKSRDNIFIVEGEKCVDAFNKISKNKVQVISWIGGTKGVKHADWKSLPENRKYILFPDADDVGRESMLEVAKLLPAPASIRIVNTPDKPKGWDIADAVEEGWSLEDIIMFIKDNLEVIYPKPKPKSPPELKLTYDDTYFKCMGFNGKYCYFYHRATGQIYSLKNSELSSKTTLMTIAPLSWWQETFPKSTKGRSWDYIGDMLLRENEKIGLYDPDMVRHRGAYIDEGRSLLHLGNKIICEGKQYAPDRFPSKYIYMRCLPLGLATGDVMSSSEASKLPQLCRMARWEEEFYGDILAGWLFASLVCGVMPFRSHLYLIGASGSGKSWVMDNIVYRAMGKMPLYCSSKTTEPGIRKILNNDVRPVIFNEAEAETQSDVLRMKAIFDLSRQASDENSFAVHKGSGDGESYIIHSSFMFASINKSMANYADVNRTTIIKLDNSPHNATNQEKLDDNSAFRALENFANQLLTPNYVASLLSRAVKLIPQMRKNHSVIANVEAKNSGKFRNGQTMAMVLTGLYSLQYDDYITEDKALVYLTEMSAITKSDEVEIQDQEKQALDKLLFTEIKIEDTTSKIRLIKLNKAILLMTGHISDLNGIDGFFLKDKLAEDGISIDNDYVIISTKKECIANKAFRKTLWESGWIEALKRLDGVIFLRRHIFTDYLSSSVIKIPINQIISKN